MKTFGFTLVTLLFQVNLWACDICGGMAGTSPMNGVLPYFDVKQFSLGYQSIHQTHPNTLFNQYQNQQVKSDLIRQIQWQGQQFIHPKWQMQWGIPYVLNKRVLERQIQYIEGIGDLNGTIRYLVLNESDSGSQKFKKLLLVGAGISLPTGKFQRRGNDLSMYPFGLQPGTGSYQWSFQQQSSVKYKSWSLLLTSQFQMAQVNELNYQMGKSFQNQIGILKQIAIRESLVLPQIGFRQFYKDYDLSNQQKKAFTRVNLVNTLIALNGFYKNISLQFQYQIPIYQETDHAQPKQKSIFNVSMGYLLMKQKE